MKDKQIICPVCKSINIKNIDNKDFTMYKCMDCTLDFNYISKQDKEKIK